jgi:hypothetical protein
MTFHKQGSACARSLFLILILSSTSTLAADSIFDLPERATPQQLEEALDRMYEQAVERTRAGAGFYSDLSNSEVRAVIRSHYKGDRALPLLMKVDRYKDPDKGWTYRFFQFQSGRYVSSLDPIMPEMFPIALERGLYDVLNEYFTTRRPSNIRLDADAIGAVIQWFRDTGAPPAGETLIRAIRAEHDLRLRYLVVKGMETLTSREAYRVLLTTLFFADHQPMGTSARLNSVIREKTVSVISEHPIYRALTPESRVQHLNTELKDLGKTVNPRRIVERVKKK